MTHNGKRSLRRRHLQIVGEVDQLRPTEEDLLKLEDNCTVGAGSRPGLYTREMSRAQAGLPPEMPEERLAGEVLPRLETTVPLPWWQTTGALGAAVVLLLVAAVVLGKACYWLGR